MPRPDDSSRFRGERPLLLAVFFLSGVAALIYEVLWLEELGLIFGNTAQAAATTLAVFFLGLAVGSRFMGQRAPRLASPLRAYAWLELLIAVSALLYFLLAPAFAGLYTTLYPIVGGRPAVITLVKLILGLGLLFPPAFFMGGTLPAMGQHLVRRSRDLGRTGTLLYALNTVGAAVGALLAGFYLPAALGFTAAYAVPIGLNLVVAATAWALSRPGPPVSRDAAAPDEAIASSAPAPGGELGLIRIVAFGSGFLALGLEVLWTRMFAQVMHNSVYSFTVILVTFLVALAAGSGVANLLCRRSALAPHRALAALAAAAALLVALSPVVFSALSPGLDAVEVSGGWARHVAQLAGLAAAVMLLPVLVLGSLYPYLLKVAEDLERAPGQVIGHLAAVNAVGGILGSLLAGFVVLSALGLWASIQVLAAGYLGLAVIAMARRPTPGRAAGALATASAGAVVLVVVAPTLPVVAIDRAAGDRLLEVWETRSGTVAVVERQRDRDRWILVDSHYSLGGVGAAASEQRQAQIPLFVQPDPEAVFFLGMGTGITAGAALDFPVERVVTCELIPEVVTAARRHFAPFINGLLEDPRSTVVVEDGRHYLMATRERFDVIVSDLFVPWQAGTGSLYTREHYATVRDRLAPGGLFVQWLGGHQVSRAEFDVVARTLLEVFPQVTLWRADFVPQQSICGLFCQAEPQPLDPAAIARNVGHVLPPRAPDRVTEADVVPYILYAGNLGLARDLFAGAAVNTDDHPVIEYLAPRTRHAVSQGRASWLLAEELLALLDEIAAAAPVERDPFLARLAPEQLDYVRAGRSLYRVGVLLNTGRADEAAPLYRDFLEVVPFPIFPGLENR